MIYKCLECGESQSWKESLTKPLQANTGLPDPARTQAFQRATADPGFIGYRLAQLRQVQSLTPRQQARALGISLDSLAGLCLCPQPEDLEDVQRIAARMRVQVEGMALLLGVGMP